MGRYTVGRTTAQGVVVLLALLLGTACASGGAGAGSGRGNVITREMIGDPGNENAFTLVRRLRPRWLSPRTQATIVDPNPSFPEVYLDNMHFGPIDTLYRINAAQIDSIEFLSGLDATTRFGLGHDGGAIIVRTFNSGPR